MFNPSNFGISLTLLLFPWVGIAPAYHFTENISGSADWLLVGGVVLAGTALNWRVTRRLPLIAAWLTGFVLQAFIRTQLLGGSFAASLVPMSGIAFLLFTFYMVTDPPTTPRGVRGQVLFGLSVAAVYAGLMAAHIVFGLFFALSIVCIARYAWARLGEGVLLGRRASSRSDLLPLAEVRHSP